MDQCIDSYWFFYRQFVNLLAYWLGKYVSGIYSSRRRLRTCGVTERESNVLREL
jgi:hypothetical protein